MKSFSRVLLYSLFAFIIFIIVFIGFTPSIISTDWGKNQLEKTINHFIQGEVHIRSLQLHWGKGQKIEGFIFKDEQGQSTISFEKLYTEACLWKLIKKNPGLGFTRVKDLNVNLQSTIALKEVQGNFYLSGDPSIPFSANLKGNTQQASTNGSFDINLLLNGFGGSSWKEWSLDAQKYFSIEGSKDAKLEAQIVNFPVVVIDHLLNQSILQPLLGDTLNANLSKIPDEEGLAFNLTISSPKLHGDANCKISKDIFSLNGPANLELTLPPEIVNEFVKLNVTSPTQVNLQLEKLQFPMTLLSTESKIDPCQLAIQGVLKAKSNEKNLTAMFSSALCEKQMKVLLSGQADQLNVSGNATLNKPENSKNLLDQLLKGIKSQVSIESWGTVSLEQTSPNTYEGLFTIQTPTIATKEGHYTIGIHDHFLALDVSLPGFNLKGNLSDEQVFSLSKPISVEYTITPDTLNELTDKFGFKRIPQIQKPTLLQMHLEQTSIDLKDDWLSKLNLKGTILMDQIVFEDQSKLGLILQKIKVPFIIDSPKNRLDIHFDAEALTSNDKKPNPLTIDLNVAKWMQNRKIDFQQAVIELSTKMIQMPTSMFSRFISDEDLSPLLGPTMDLELHTLIDRQQLSEGYWDMHIDSSLLHARARLFIDEAITLYESKNSPAIIRLKITPESYAFIQNHFMNSPSNLTLSEPFTITSHLSSLNLPLTPGKNPTQFKAHLSTSEWHSKQFPSLNGLQWNGIIETQDWSKRIDFNLITDSKNTFTFNIEGQINQNQKLNARVDTKQVPAELFQLIPLMDQNQLNRLKALIGDKIDSQTTLQLNQLAGVVKSSVSGPNGAFKFDGNLKKGVLSLASPFEWTIRVTPELGTTILDKNIPFFNHIVGADQPIKLIISPDGFSCPVNPFDISQLTIGKGEIRSGKINFLNEGEIKSLFNYISPLSEKELTIWFTPIYFHAKGGELKVERFDFLIDHHYPLACWGTINLKTHDYDLVLGLTPKTLKKAFGVKELQEDYMLQVPVKGRKGHFKVDKSRLVARISALVAKTKGGDKVKIFGTLLDMAVSEGGDPSAPKPTTTPFPWD